MDKDQYISITLPSKGLAYTDVDMSAIKIRPFKGKDEALIVELTAENIKKKFVTVIENVLQGITPELLTSGDAKYIMLWEALNSYDQKYPVRLICEDCLQKIDVVCDLSKINNNLLPDNYVQPISINLSDKTIQLRLLTFGDEIAILDWKKNNDSDYLYSYALSIVDKENGVTTILQKLKMLEEMSTQDLNKIKEFHKEYDHGPDMLASYVCPLCDFEGSIELPFRFDELFSFN